MKTFLHMNAGDVGKEQSCVADHAVAVGKEIMYSLCIYQFTLKLCVFFARDREYCSKDMGTGLTSYHWNRGSKIQMYGVW